MSKKSYGDTIKKSLGDDSLSSLFQQMLGSGEPSPAVIRPKLMVVISNVTIIYKLLNAFVVELKACGMELDHSISEISSFCTRLDSILLTLNVSDLNDTNIVEKYKGVKESDIMVDIMQTCKILIGEKACFASNGVDIGFISRMPGLSFQPFSFSSINLKEIWAHDGEISQFKKYIMTVCKIMYEKTYKIYEVITSADIDIEEFSKLIMQSIKQVKKQIPRCDKAFSKIEASIGLLKGNFSGYYKDFIQTQNPSIIMNNFIYDVASTDDTDMQTVYQFKKIIAYYQKHTQGKIKDPRVKKIFELLNANMKILEGNNGGGGVDDNKDMSDDANNNDNNNNTKT